MTIQKACFHFLVIWLLIGAVTVESYAQVSDDFSDGDFTNDPAWVGSTGDFIIEEGVLRSNGPEASSVIYLSTPSSAIDDATWEFKVELGFAPSSANFVRIFLVSDVSDLSGDLNGYFLEIGESGNDNINFYLKEGSTETLLQTGNTDLSGNIVLGILVTRDATANWTVSADISGGTDYIEYIASFQDNTHTSTAYFGFVADYNNSSRHDLYYFDDINPPFTVNSVSQESTNTLRIVFSDDVDPNTAEDTSLYEVDFGYGQPSTAMVDTENGNQVVLTFDTEFSNNSYYLTIDGVQRSDLSETISDVEFSFDVAVATDFRAIVINELMVDEAPAQGLPEAEFVELYNAGDYTIDIGEFQMEGQDIEDYTLSPGEYVIIVDDLDVALFSGYTNVAEISSLSLTNTGETIALYDNLGNLVDSLTYDLDWYQDATKQDGGYTIEQINPVLPCNYSGNWAASTNADGGTPGLQNSIFDNSPDTSGPYLVDLEISDPLTFVLTFDEPIDDTSFEDVMYTISPTTSIESTALSQDLLSATISLAENLVSGTDYSVSVSGITDCLGNEIQSAGLTVHFDNLPPELEEITVISDTELYLSFNESLSSAQAENEENYLVNNDVGSPVTAEQNEDLSNQIYLYFAIPFMLDNEHTLSINHLADTLGNSLSGTLNETFVYSEGIDTVQVISANHLRVFFEEDVQESSATNTENYLVDEGIGAPISVFMGSSAGNMVNLVFQNDLEENQDLTLMVDDIFNTSGEKIVTPWRTFIYDTYSPKLDTLYVSAGNELTVVFDEKVERVSAESPEYYEYEDIFPRSAQLQSDEQTVVLTFEDEFAQEVEFELYIDEVADLYGNAIGTRLRESFVYDVFPPTLASAWFKSPTELVIQFSEPVDTEEATAISNFSIGGIGNPVSAVQNLEYKNMVTLDFEDDLPETNLTLTVSAMTDTRGNQTEQSIEQEVDNTVLYIGSFYTLDQHTIEIELSKLTESTEVEETSSYLLDGLHRPLSAEVNGRILILSFSEEFVNGQSYVLYSSIGLASQDYDFIFDSYLETVIIIDNSTIEIAFEVNLDQDVIFDHEMFSLEPDVGSPNAIVVGSEDPSILRLIFDENIQADINYTLSWPLLTNEYGNLFSGYSVELTIDETPPSLDSLSVLDENSLLVRFSEPLLESSAEFLANYEVDLEVGSPIEATYMSDSIVLLDFERSFLDGEIYVLTITNVKDLSGNPMDIISSSFEYEAPYAPVFGDLIISEVLPEPTEDQTEFIELYNSSSKTIHLAGLVLGDYSREVVFTGGTIEPGQFLILADNEELFADQNLGSISSWLSLNNSTDLLYIMNDEEIIFSMIYTDDWYKSETKKEGGYSLEMVDLSNPCGDLDNWTRATDPGGTPGAVNSTSAENPDTTSPFIDQAITISESTVEVVLSERFRPLSVELETLIHMSPETIIESASYDPFESDVIQVTFFENLNPQTTYEISFSGLQDCVGNHMSDEERSSEITIPVEADSLDVLINEILFNPRTGGVDFVELYNHSDKLINLQGWHLADATDDLRTITNDNVLLLPSEYLVLTSDTEVLSADYPFGDEARYLEVASMPNFNDDGDSVMIYNLNNQLIDQLVYEDNYHFSLLNDDEGVALERIDFDVLTDDPDSWSSAASTVGFATPGLLNSQFVGLQEGNDLIAIEPKVFFPDNTGQNDFTTISFENTVAGSFANIKVYNVQGQPVRTLAENELLAASGVITWDGTTDQGNLAGIGYYIVWFEIFDSNGNKKVEKETVVLGMRF